MLTNSLIVALLFFAGAIADYQDEEKILEAYVTNKCLKNGGEKALENLKNKGEELGERIFNAIFNPRMNDFEYICGEFRSTVYSGLFALAESIEPCLDNVEKFLPDFMITFYNSSTEEHCKDTGKKLEDDLEVLKRVNCKSKGEEANNYIYEKCFGKSTVLKDFEDVDFVIPKNLFCGYLEHANQCAIDYVKDNCDVDFAELVESLLQPTKKWCDGYVENELKFVAPPNHN